MKIDFIHCVFNVKFDSLRRFFIRHFVTSFIATIHFSAFPKYFKLINFRVEQSKKNRKSIFRFSIQNRNTRYFHPVPDTLPHLSTLSSFYIYIYISNYKTPIIHVASRNVGRMEEEKSFLKVSRAHSEDSGSPMFPSGNIPLEW